LDNIFVFDVMAQFLAVITTEDINFHLNNPLDPIPSKPAKESYTTDTLILDRYHKPENKGVDKDIVRHLTVICQAQTTSFYYMSDSIS
jgi:hypothetical protein